MNIQQAESSDYKDTNESGNRYDDMWALLVRKARPQQIAAVDLGKY